MKKEIIEPKQIDSETKADILCTEYYKNRKKYPSTGLIVNGIDIGYERHRDKYPDFPFVDKVDNVKCCLEFFKSGRAEKYVPSKIEGNEIVLFIHGGGWSAGSVDRYKYVCKYIAKTFKRLTYSVDYDQAPEFVYPHQINQINDIINELCVNGRKVILFGDSAGGNLVLAETLKQKDTGNVVSQILFYPSVDMTDRFDSQEWSIDKYGESTEFEKSIIIRLRPKDGLFAPYYIRDEQRAEDLASPLYMKDHSFYPKTILCLAGLDYLRLQGETLAEKIDKEGVDTTLFIYKGIAHGFLDRLYYFWQAEDSIQRVYNEYMRK